jgi:predicted ATPase
MMHGNTKLVLVLVLVSGSGPITLSYKQYVKSGRLHLDKDQLSLSASLLSILCTQIYQQSIISRFQMSIYPTPLSIMPGVLHYHLQELIHLSTPIQKAFIHGSVGAGKSMLMDTFYANDVVQYDPITMKCA